MNEERAQLIRWTGCLLDGRCSPGEWREATQAWYRRWIELLGIRENDATLPGQAVGNDLALESGLAIAPISGARCVMDYARTARFVQGLHAAVAAAFERFPGETIHVLEAGCGPFAPLAFSCAAKYPPGRVQFTLLDAHAISLEFARQLAGHLGVSESIRAFLHDDASRVVFADGDRPHIVVCELIQRALAKEPQVAATLHLAPQVRAGGFFLPARIEVHAALFDAHAHFSRIGAPTTADRLHDHAGITELGSVFTLDPKNLPRRPTPESRSLCGNPITVPAHNPNRSPLHLLTSIEVFGNIRLNDFACAITLPEPVREPAETAPLGSQMTFDYALTSAPGFQIRRTAGCD